MEKNKSSSIFSVNILYLILGLLLFFLGSFVQAREIYSGLLITEFIIILIPNIIYLKVKKKSLKTSLRLNRISLKQVVYVVFITIFSYPIAIFLNTLILTIINFTIDISPTTVPLPETFPSYIKSLLVIGLAPGICEEIMFRGSLLSAYESLGPKKAILYSAILFGVFHLTILNLIGPIFLGIVLGIVAYKTNSIYASIIGHTLNNSIALTLGYFAMKSQANMEELIEAVEPSRQEMTIMLIIMFTLAYISFFIVKKLIKHLPQGQVDPDYFRIKEQEDTNKLGDFIPIIFIIILFLFVNT